MFMAGQWRESYFAFAVAALLCGIVAWRILPASAGMAEPHARRSRVPSMRNALWRLSVFGFGMGLVSSAYWVFAPDLIGTVGDLPERSSAWLWLALGVGGLVAGAASDLGDRLGIARVQGAALAGLGLTLLLLAQWPGAFTPAIVSAVLFGTFYMMLTGIYLITGVRLLAEHPSLGPVVPFVAIAVGQSVGSPLAGVLVETIGHIDAFRLTAVVGVVLGLAYRWFPYTRPAEAENAPQNEW
jgi:predicted MFS family arabinose efflux permease